MSDGASQRFKELSLRRGTKGMGPYPKRYSRKPLARTGECEAFFVTPATVQEIFPSFNHISSPSGGGENKLDP
jgi:hypothetical protein